MSVICTCVIEEILRLFSVVPQKVLSRSVDYSPLLNGNEMHSWLTSSLLHSIIKCLLLRHSITSDSLVTSSISHLITRHSLTHCSLPLSEFVETSSVQLILLAFCMFNLVAILRSFSSSCDMSWIAESTVPSGTTLTEMTRSLIATPPIFFCPFDVPSVFSSKP